MRSSGAIATALLQANRTSEVGLVCIAATSSRPGFSNNLLIIKSLSGHDITTTPHLENANGGKQLALGFVN